MGNPIYLRNFGKLRTPGISNKSWKSRKCITSNKMANMSRVSNRMTRFDVRSAVQAGSKICGLLALLTSNLVIWLPSFDTFDNPWGP